MVLLSLIEKLPLAFRQHGGADLLEVDPDNPHLKRLFCIVQSGCPCHVLLVLVLVLSRPEGWIFFVPCGRNAKRTLERHLEHHATYESQAQNLVDKVS